MKNCKNFTLIELLIVIVIITILASMTLPIMSKAGKEAKAISCASNLKQNIAAMTMYANNYDKAIPLMFQNTPAIPATWWPSWVDILLESGELTSTELLSCPTPPTPDALVIPIPGPGYATYNNVYGVWRVGSYFGTQSLDGGGFWGLSLNKINDPSNFMLMADSYANSPNTSPSFKGQFAFIKASAGNTAYAAHAKHNGRINAAYIDGHVSLLLPTEYKATVNKMETDGAKTASPTIYYFDENTTMQAL